MQLERVMRVKYFKALMQCCVITNRLLQALCVGLSHHGSSAETGSVSLCLYLIVLNTTISWDHGWSLFYALLHYLKIIIRAHAEHSSFLVDTN